MESWHVFHGLVLDLFRGACVHVHVERLSCVRHVHCLVAGAAKSEPDVHDEIASEDLLDMHLVGNTMYVSIKPLTERRNLFGDRSQLSATLVIPKRMNIVMDDR